MEKATAVDTITLKCLNCDMTSLTAKVQNYSLWKKKKQKWYFFVAISIACPDFSCKLKIGCMSNYTYNSHLWEPSLPSSFSSFISNPFTGRKWEQFPSPLLPLACCWISILCNVTARLLSRSKSPAKLSDLLLSSTKCLSSAIPLIPRSLFIYSLNFTYKVASCPCSPHLPIDLFFFILFSKVKREIPVNPCLLFTIATYVVILGLFKGTSTLMPLLQHLEYFLQCIVIHLEEKIWATCNRSYVTIRPVCRQVNAKGQISTRLTISIARDNLGNSAQVTGTFLLGQCNVLEWRCLGPCNLDLLRPTQPWAGQV